MLVNTRKILNSNPWTDISIFKLVPHLPHPLFKKSRIKIPVRKKGEDVSMVLIQVKDYFLAIG